MENKLVRSVLIKRNRGTLMAVSGVILVLYLLAIISTVSNYQLAHYKISVSLVGGNDPALLMFAVAVILGVSVFLIDGQTKFNEFLFALPVRKTVIFWQKVRIFWETFTVSTVVGMLLFYTGVLLMLPGRAIHSSIWSIFWNSVSQISMLTFVFALSMFAGLIIGRPVLAFFTVLGFWIGFIFFWEGVNYIAATTLALLKNRKIPADYSDILLAHIQPATFTGAITLIGLMAIIVGFFLWWGQRLFKQLSLENNGRFLLFPEYRLALLVVFVVFMGIAVGFSDLIAVPLSIVGNLTDYISPVKRSLVVLVTMLISWFFGRWVIYRPDRVKDIFGWRHLD